MTVGLINVIKNAHRDYEVVKKFGNDKIPQTHEAKIKYHRIQDLWNSLDAIENNIHPRRREQKLSEMLYRLIGITANFTKGIEIMVNDEGEKCILLRHILIKYRLRFGEFCIRVLGSVDEK